MSPTLNDADAMIAACAKAGLKLMTGYILRFETGYGADGVPNLNLTPMNLYGCDRERWKLPDTRHWPEVTGKLVGAVKLELEHFFECILRDEEPLVSGEDGRRSLEIALAAARSIAQGGPVPLPL